MHYQLIAIERNSTIKLETTGKWQRTWVHLYQALRHPTWVNLHRMTEYKKQIPKGCKHIARLHLPNTPDMTKITEMEHTG